MKASVLNLLSRLLRRLFLQVLSCAFAAGIGLAQELPSGLLYLADSSDDRVLRCEDLDGSGRYETDSPGEVSVFYEPSGDDPVLSVPSHLARVPGSEGAIYLLDGGALDAILRLEDLDGDGRAAGPEEVRTVYDGSAAGPGFGTPNTLLALDDGRLLVADDGSRQRQVLSLYDLNADGDFLDEGESIVAFDQANGSGMTLEDPESLAFSVDEGALYLGDTSTGRILRLVDLNESGDWQQEGEATVFHRSTEAEPLTDLDALLVRGSVIYAADEDTGRVLALRDANEDGEAEGAGEVWPFLDASAPFRVRDLNDMAFLGDAGFLFFDGSKDTVWMGEDLNFDGDVLDEGELAEALFDTTEEGVLATPSAGVFVASGGEPPPPPSGFLRGDANLDRRVDLSDALAILGYLFLGSEPLDCEDAGDADDSGEINISDPIYVLNYLFNGGAVPSSPFEGPGRDPTEDALGCAIPLD